MPTVAAIALLLTILGLIESRKHARRRAGIAVRILVNGTRGKTTVTRMLTSALQKAGYTAIGKTTGSEASTILPDGTVIPTSRKRGFNLIRETCDIFRLAHGRNADAVVIECMALRPEAQRMIARLVKPTVSVITNARIDHVDMMGDTIESTCGVLVQSVPKECMFYTSDLAFMEDDRAILVPGGRSAKERNEALCLKILTDLGMDVETARGGMAGFVPDIGLEGPFEVDGRHVINAFAANDAQSAGEVLQSLADIEHVTVIYNNRADREFRLRYFAQLFTDFNVPNVIIIGDNLSKCRRFLSGNVLGSMVSTYKGDWSGLLGLCDRTVVGMGNIKGEGKAFLDFCKFNGGKTNPRLNRHC